MRGYLLDTSHVGAVMRPVSAIRERINRANRLGFRVGTCVPIICETLAGLWTIEKRQSFLRAFERSLVPIRLWPLDTRTAQCYAEVYQQLRSAGRVLSQADMMLAALARHMGLTVLPTDRDFEALPDIRTENWLVGP